jgi:Rab proteins geranylgeranyltransferase component A
VIYASTLCDGPHDRQFLDLAVESLLFLVDSDESETKVLWNMYYEQLGTPGPSEASKDKLDRLFSFPPSSLDLAFDDGVMETVRDAWRFVLGEEAKDEDFLSFLDRDGEESEEDTV